MAADRAGIELGRRALSAPEYLLKLLPHLHADDAWIPVTGDLPSGLSAAAFAARFGQVGSEPYRRVLLQIDQRVAGLAMLRPSGP